MGQPPPRRRNPRRSSPSADRVLVPNWSLSLQWDISHPLPRDMLCPIRCEWTGSWLGPRGSLGCDYAARPCLPVSCPLHENSWTQHGDPPPTVSSAAMTPPSATETVGRLSPQPKLAAAALNKGHLGAGSDTPGPGAPLSEERPALLIGDCHAGQGHLQAAGRRSC